MLTDRRLAWLPSKKPNKQLTKTEILMPNQQREKIEDRRTLYTDMLSSSAYMELSSLTSRHTNIYYICHSLFLRCVRNTEGGGNCHVPERTEKSILKNCLKLCLNIKEMSKKTED